ncbi:MAG: tRNA lysidine(34) synthetase TilS [Verrucomicrobiota bacterium]
MNGRQVPGLKQLDTEFAEALRQRLPIEDRYLVAVSGGQDSMALLHFLKEAGYSNLIVAHVNHGLRGDSSDADEAFVRGEARGLPFECERGNVANLAEKPGLSLETAAREFRYESLARISERTTCCLIFLAHHADDQVETILINLFRGTGGRGLGGMRERSERDGLVLLRPFLEIPRSEIEHYIRENSIPFREDASNAEDFALRNRVRNRLLPAIHEIFERDVTGAVLRAAELARKDEDWAAVLESELPPLGEGLSVAALRALPEAQRDRLLLLWLRNSEVPDCGLREVETIVEVLHSNDRPAKANLPGGVHVRRREGILFLEFPETKGSDRDVTG